ncbi:MAG: ABC transporter ATP-binding protein [Bifidobacteriaceae bacterium]|jgi:oligopeptide/dipeptide ABC transporter ATP-binding protein|nr:ABC transporter ATP-binding protein [Bifidobacteriaceae bacterium]
MNSAAELNLDQTADGIGPVLDVQGLTVELATAGGWTRIIEDVTFAVKPGTAVGIVGESGSGKSVTALSVMGLLPQSGSRIVSGSVTLDGEELLGQPERRLQDIRGNRMTMIFQEPMSSLNPAFTVGYQIAELARRHLGASKREATQMAIEVLDRVGIPNAKQRKDSYPHEFSGGMCQRVLIAMAILCNPRVLIADEPTTALDVTIQAGILDLLKEMVRELSIGLVLVTHDLGVIADVCDRVAVMYGGQIVAADDVQGVFAHPTHPYAEGLMVSLPQIGTGSRALATIPGEAVTPDAIPPGCRFHPRCPFAQERCSIDQPTLRTLHGGAMTRCPRYEELDLKGPAR